jgi:signal peptidase I
MAKAVEQKPQKSLYLLSREWVDALVIAIMLAMFVKMFAVEMFKIPSPSMTPTLLGTQAPMHSISYYDVDHDGLEDMLLLSYPHRVHVYRNQGNGSYLYDGEPRPGAAYDLWARKQQQRQDHILVAKFLYWFAPPRRGDIVIFKTPESIFEPALPVFIKRVVGLPGEKLGFEPCEGVTGHEDTMAHLTIDGKRVEKPIFFQSQRYEYRDLMQVTSDVRPDYAQYTDYGIGPLTMIQGVNVPEGMIYVFGDNTVSSRDSRYFGGVVLDRLRGRAIMRLWKVPGFLR